MAKIWASRAAGDLIECRTDRSTLWDIFVSELGVRDENDPSEAMVEAMIELTVDVAAATVPAIGIALAAAKISRDLMKIASCSGELVGASTSLEAGLDRVARWTAHSLRNLYSRITASCVSRRRSRRTKRKATSGRRRMKKKLKKRTKRA